MPDDVLSQFMRMLSTGGGNAIAGLPQLAQAGPPGMAALPGAWPGAPRFWNQLPPEGIPAQEPWRLGGDNVVSPRTGLGINAAGIYGRGGALPAPADNRDTVVPAAAGMNLNALIRLLQQVGIGSAAPAAGLPPAVQRSITGMPSYGEGEMTPYIRGDPSAILQEKPLNSGPQRDQALMNELYMGRNPQGPVADGGWGGGWGSGQRGNAYPSPLNQLIGRAPLGLY